VLVNTAAVMRPCGLDTLPLEEWNAVLSINNLGDTISDRNQNEPILHGKFLFFINPVENYAVWIIASIDCEIFDAVNSPWVQKSLHGTFLGFPSDHIGMEVAVTVTVGARAE